MIEKIKQVGQYILIAALILFATGMCVNKTLNKAVGEGNVYETILERKNKEYKDAENKATKVVDSLKRENLKKDEAISNLKKENSSLDNKITILSKNRESSKVKVKKLTYKESSETIGLTYNAPESVSYDNDGVKLLDSLPNRVVETIEDKKFLEDKLGLTEQKVTNLEGQNKLLSETVQNKSSENEILADLNKQGKEALEATNQVVKSEQKQNRKLKQSNFVLKVGVVAAFALGILTAK